MTSEEQGAIEQLKAELEVPNSIPLYWAIDNVLKLVVKQQKEIEEKNCLIDVLQHRIEELLDNKKEINYIKPIDIKPHKYISEEKIEEKIKELENQNEENKIELAKGIDTLNFDTIENAKNNIAINVNVRDILKGLLEEKNAE